MYQQLKRASMALALGSVCIGAFAQQKTIQGTVKDSTSVRDNELYLKAL